MITAVAFVLLVYGGLEQVVFVWLCDNLSMSWFCLPSSNTQIGLCLPVHIFEHALKVLNLLLILDKIMMIAQTI